MDEVMIRNWNALIRPKDTIYHLGDVSFHNPTRTREILGQLNGHKILILDNHDEHHKVRKTLGQCFDEVHEELILTINEQRVQLAHVPSYLFPENCLIQLCGHVHEQWAVRNYIIKGAMILNVGVDVRNFQPMALEEIQNLLPKPFTPRMA